jgi:hypothetical protein
MVADGTRQLNTRFRGVTARRRQAGLAASRFARLDLEAELRRGPLEKVLRQVLLVKRSTEGPAPLRAV